MWKQQVLPHPLSPLFWGYFGPKKGWTAANKIGLKMHSAPDGCKKKTSIIILGCNTGRNEPIFYNVYKT